jgi:2-hydroxychromene-2-carboxylate isomerase
MNTPELQFWFEFGSTYSYLSATRIEEAASAAGVTVSWEPFLLGPIFKDQG